jgi:hypothetical protein
MVEILFVNFFYSFTVREHVKSKQFVYWCEISLNTLGFTYTCTLWSYRPMQQDLFKKFLLQKKTLFKKIINIKFESFSSSHLSIKKKKNYREHKLFAKCQLAK